MEFPPGAIRSQKELKSVLSHKPKRIYVVGKSDIYYNKIRLFWMKLTAQGMVHEGFEEADFFRPTPTDEFDSGRWQTFVFTNYWFAYSFALSKGKETSDGPTT